METLYSRLDAFLDAALDLLLGNVFRMEGNREKQYDIDRSQSSLSEEGSTNIGSQASTNLRGASIPAASHHSIPDSHIRESINCPQRMNENERHHLIETLGLRTLECVPDESGRCVLIGDD